jgi:hypothetical protein
MGVGDMERQSRRPPSRAVSSPMLRKDPSLEQRVTTQAPNLPPGLGALHFWGL